MSYLKIFSGLRLDMNGLSIVIVAIQVEMNAPKIEGQYPRAQAGIT